MFDPAQESRHIAAFALGQLLMNDRSAEAAVRAVLRVATLRDHAWWQFWAFLQLNDTYEQDELAGAHRLIGRALPEATRRDDILESAKEDVLWTRRTGIEENEHYLADIGDVERDLTMYDTDLGRAIDVSRLAQRDMRHRIVNRVKNRAQEYLMLIETNRPISGVATKLARRRLLGWPIWNPLRMAASKVANTSIRVA